MRQPKLKSLPKDIDMREEVELRRACMSYVKELELSIKSLETMGYGTYTNPALADMYEAHNQLLKHLPEKEA